MGFNNSYTNILNDSSLGVVHLWPKKHRLQDQVTDFWIQRQCEDEDVIRTGKFDGVVCPLVKFNLPKGGKKLFFERGLYSRIDALILELNTKYKQGHNPTYDTDIFDLVGTKLRMTLRRDNNDDCWRVPLFNQVLCLKLGVPFFKHPEFQTMVNQIPMDVLEYQLTMTDDIKLNRSDANHVGVFIDILNPQINGMRDGEVLRLGGNLAMNPTATNHYDFDTLVLHRLKTPVFKRIRVTFKTLDGSVCNFPVGLSHIILEFRKNDCKYDDANTVSVKY